MDRDGDRIDDSLEGGLAPGPIQDNISNGYLCDSDGDGLDDGVEDANRNGSWEAGLETRTRSADTDGDGWEDGIEVLLLNTDPLDGDDPLEELVDLDQDGLPSGYDPDDENQDTDGDRFLDSYEEVALPGSAQDALTMPGLGDVNVDSVYDNGDAQLTLSFFGNALAGHPEITFDPDRSDVNRNGTIDNGDAQMMLSFFGTLLPTYPIN
jgi:hypothetical protein